MKGSAPRTATIVNSTELTRSGSLSFSPHGVFGTPISAPLGVPCWTSALFPVPALYQCQVLSLYNPQSQTGRNRQRRQVRYVGKGPVSQGAPVPQMQQLSHLTQPSPGLEVLENTLILPLCESL